MKVTLTNQHDTNTATANVLVGCGLDGDEGNEPSFRYVINADGCSISRDTDDGSPLGHVHLNNDDLDRLCGVVGVSRDAPKLYEGDEAERVLQEFLVDASAAAGLAKVWALQGPQDSSAWVELLPSQVRECSTALAVMVDIPNTYGGGTSKFTYYASSKTGLLLPKS